MNNDYLDRLMDGALNVVDEAWNEARNNFICDIRADERNINLSLATLAMLDGGLSKEQTISQLQKYWDLRRSEAVPCVAWAQQKLATTSHTNSSPRLS